MRSIRPNAFIEPTGSGGLCRWKLRSRGTFPHVRVASKCEIPAASKCFRCAPARELLELATPAAEAEIEIDPAAALAQPCPCCGGRMFVIETFEAGCQPRYRPTAMRIDTS